MIYKDPASVLDASVLVLSRTYAAVHIISVRRAFTLLYRDSAEVVQLENCQYASYDFESWRILSDMQPVAGREVGDWVRAVGGDIRTPQVIRLLKYDGLHRPTLRFSRRSLFARDEHRCQYCGNRFAPEQLSFDHVLPRSRGGETNWEIWRAFLERC